MRRQILILSLLNLLPPTRLTSPRSNHRIWEILWRKISAAISLTAPWSTSLLRSRSSPNSEVLLPKLASLLELLPPPRATEGGGVRGQVGAVRAIAAGTSRGTDGVRGVGWKLKVKRGRSGRICWKDCNWMLQRRKV